MMLIKTKFKIMETSQREMCIYARDMQSCLNTHAQDAAEKEA